MANAFYDKGRQNFLEGDIDYLLDNIKVISIDEADDVPILTTDEFLDPDVLAAAREFTSGNLAGKTATDGVADASDLIPAFTGATGDQFESITLYFDTGTPTTSLLMVNIDTATGLPLTPDGGNIDITWSSGANRIFKL